MGYIRVFGDGGYAAYQGSNLSDGTISYEVTPPDGSLGNRYTVDVDKAGSIFFSSITSFDPEESSIFGYDFNGNQIFKTTISDEIHAVCALNNGNIFLGHNYDSSYNKANRYSIIDRSGNFITKDNGYLGTENGQFLGAEHTFDGYIYPFKGAGTIKIYKFDENINKQWEKELNYEPTHVTTHKNDDYLFISNRNKASKIDSSNGSINWTIDITNSENSVVGQVDNEDGYVYYGNGYNAVKKDSNGNTIWSNFQRKGQFDYCDGVVGAESEYIIGGGAYGALGYKRWKKDGTKDYVSEYSGNIGAGSPKIFYFAKQTSPPTLDTLAAQNLQS